MRKGLIVFFLLMSGCTGAFQTKFRCINGVLFIQDNGAWIEALVYKNNRCVPMDGP